MPASPTAIGPSAVVTEVPGRFSPTYVVDRRGIASQATSSATNSVLAYLPRVDTVDTNASTPTTEVTEVGANYHVGEFDDLPDSTLKITAYDVGYHVISSITGKNAPAASTTHYTFNDFATASVDVIRQFADPNGKIFMSQYMGDMVVTEFNLSLKSKSAAMEDYNFAGFNMLYFQGFFVTKAYVVQAADVTANSFSIASVLGVDEAPVPLDTPSGSQPASYWQGRGSYNFIKVEKYRPTTGFVRVPETAGAVSPGYAKYTSGTTTLAFGAGDLVAGDVIFLTFMTYKTNVVITDGSNTNSYGVIPQTTLDTSDAVAVSTRLTPFTISANNIPRGAAFDAKIGLKRERAEGIGDPDGIWGPPDSPTVDISLDVKMTDFGLLSTLMTGTPTGTNQFSPVDMTRRQLAANVPIVVTINDPRSAGVVLKTYIFPAVAFKTFNNGSQSKTVISHKLTGNDKVGNFDIAVIRP